jgi:hypothetical protein
LGRIKDLLPGKEGDPGVTAADNRLFVDPSFRSSKVIETRYLAK